MSTCDVWPGDDGPCGMPAVETLVFLNPLCGGTGELDVCTAHLREHMEEHCLIQPYDREDKAA